MIYARLRPGTLSALAVEPHLTFNELNDLLQASDGDSSVHARKQEGAGYPACRKSFDGRLPRTEFRITPKGRRALERYLAPMEALIREMRETR